MRILTNFFIILLKNIKLFIIVDLRYNVEWKKRDDARKYCVIAET